MTQSGLISLTFQYFTYFDEHKLTAVMVRHQCVKFNYKALPLIGRTCFWVAEHRATHIFVWIWGSNMAAFPAMVPDFFIL